MLPDATHVYAKTYNGPPTYFTMQPSEYCSDENLTTCVRVSSNPDRSVYVYSSKFRWCSSYTAASGGTVGRFNVMVTPCRSLSGS